MHSNIDKESRCEFDARAIEDLNEPFKLIPPAFIDDIGANHYEPMHVLTDAFEARMRDEGSEERKWLESNPELFVAGPDFSHHKNCSLSDNAQAVSLSLISGISNSTLENWSCISAPFEQFGKKYESLGLLVKLPGAVLCLSPMESETNMERIFPFSPYLIRIAIKKNPLETVGGSHPDEAIRIECYHSSSAAYRLITQALNNRAAVFGYKLKRDVEDEQIVESIQGEFLSGDLSKWELVESRSSKAGNAGRYFKHKAIEGRCITLLHYETGLSQAELGKLKVASDASSAWALIRDAATQLPRYVSSLDTSNTTLFKSDFYMLAVSDPKLDSYVNLLTIPRSDVIYSTSNKSWLKALVKSLEDRFDN